MGAASGQSGAFRVGVLVSGEGTNLQAILDRVHLQHGVEVVAVASDKPGAPALKRAKLADVVTATFPAEQFESRQARDLAMAEWLQTQGVQLVVLAGYMQLLSPGFLDRFPNSVINVHPSLLPAFPGLRAIEQALEYGVKVFGVTVHFVDEGIDSGRIIAQRAVELAEAESAAEVRGALMPLEHQLLTETVVALAKRTG